MVGVTGSIPVAPTIFHPSRGGHEGPEFAEVPALAPPQQPRRAPQGPRLRHQQDQPPFQGAPGLVTAPRPLTATLLRGYAARMLVMPNRKAFVRLLAVTLALLVGAPMAPAWSPGSQAPPTRARPCRRRRRSATRPCPISTRCSPPPTTRRAPRPSPTRSSASGSSPAAPPSTC